MSQVTEGVGGRGTKTMVSPPSTPDMADYDLHSVRIERAQNGVTVHSEHKMKLEVEAKKKGKDGKGYVEYDERNPREQHVFNDMDAASSFISSRLTGGKWDGKGEKSEPPKQKTKVKVV